MRDEVEAALFSILRKEEYVGEHVTDEKLRDPTTTIGSLGLDESIEMHHVIFRLENRLRVKIDLFSGRDEEKTPTGTLFRNRDLRGELSLTVLVDQIAAQLHNQQELEGPWAATLDKLKKDAPGKHA